MLSRAAIGICCTFDAAVVFDPAARLARNRAILILVTFDADHPFRSTDLPPNRTASVALLECDWVGNARGAAGARHLAAIGNVEVKLRVAAAC